MKANPPHGINTLRSDSPEDETIRAEAPLQPSATDHDACLVLIYPTGNGMGMRYRLDQLPAVIGRGEFCEILANDSSVSRRHVRIELGPEGYVAVDLGSTNGTLVNKERKPRHHLKDGDYLQVGKCIYRFLASGNIEHAYHEEIYRLAIIDGLTGVFNKRYLLESLEGELVRAERYGRPLSLLMLDIDHFKSINDRWGHLAGDKILRDLAGRIAPTLRREQVFARYGGEEFAILLPECVHEEARVVGERIRCLVANEPFEVDDQHVSVTISIGVACTPAGEHALVGCRLPEELDQGTSFSRQEFIRWADSKLYEAKNAGRNRVGG